MKFKDGHKMSEEERERFRAFRFVKEGGMATSIEEEGYQWLQESKRFTRFLLVAEMAVKAERVYKDLVRYAMDLNAYCLISFTSSKDAILWEKGIPLSVRVSAVVVNEARYREIYGDNEKEDEMDALWQEVFKAL
jgi:hypothetical protein